MSFCGAFRRGLERRLLFRRHFGLVTPLPLALRHAVDQLARGILVDRNAILGGCFAIPVPKAVAAESRQRHEIDVLHICSSTKMRHKAAEYRGFELFASAFIHIGVPCKCQWPSKLYRRPAYFHQRALDDAFQAAGEGIRESTIPNQILSDLDQNMRKTQHGSMLVQTVV